MYIPCHIIINIVLFSIPYCFACYFCRFFQLIANLAFPKVYAKLMKHKEMNHISSTSMEFPSSSGFRRANMRWYVRSFKSIAALLSTSSSEGL
jgi:hypothetical protein